MADAYRAKVDVSFPKAIRKVEELMDGQEVYESVGVNYAAGDAVLAANMTPRDRERAENGELDHLLEAAEVEEVDGRMVFIPEHEAERVAFEDAGHLVVPRDQVLEMMSAGADEAGKALEFVKSEGLDERPGLTAKEVPALAEVSRGEAENVPSDSEHVDEELLVGVEQPPGIPAGEDKAALETSDEAKAAKSGRRKKNTNPPAMDSMAAETQKKEDSK